MSKPVVLVTRKLPEAVENRLSIDCDAQLNLDDALYKPDELLKRAEGADAIMPCHTEHFDAGMFERLPKSVKIVANFSVGYDHVDTEAAKKAGIVITNTPDVLSDATAEIVMLLILGAARRAGEGEHLVRGATWKDWSPAFMVGTQVTGKTLGIVGLGRVGKVVAERIALLPGGAIVVNAARGTLVDDDALIAGLKAGKPAAAGLDVYNNEPNIDPRYNELPNTFLLPHIGSATAETRDAMGFRALDNLDAFFGGNEPGDRVA